MSAILKVEEFSRGKFFVLQSGVIDAELRFDQLRPFDVAHSEIIVKRATKVFDQGQALSTQFLGFDKIRRGKGHYIELRPDWFVWGDTLETDCDVVTIRMRVISRYREIMPLPPLLSFPKE